MRIYTHLFVRKGRHEPFQIVVSVTNLHTDRRGRFFYTLEVNMRKKTRTKGKTRENWVQNTKQYDKNKRMRTEITKKDTEKV